MAGYLNRVRRQPESVADHGQRRNRYAAYAESMTDLPDGLYESLVTRAIDGSLASVPTDLVDIVAADPGDVHDALARHVAALVARTVRAAPEGDRVARGIVLANAVADLCGSAATEGDAVAGPGRELREIRSPIVGVHRPRPAVPLASNAILVNGRGEPRIGTELAREIASADHVDVIVAFLFWHGVRLIRDELAALIERGGRVRVLTTTYAGASEQRALDALVDLGAELKISYDTGATRLHAKAWLLERATGFSTAYVGSSNLSHSAQIDGLEWNVRLAQAESPALLDRFRTVFETYWASEQFEPYEPAAFGQAMGRTRGDRADAIAPFHIHPYPHQRRILEDLDVERKRHDRWRNLVVAATGTGKTVVAALDYQRLREELAADGRRTPRSCSWPTARRSCARAARCSGRSSRDGDFGEMLVAGDRPDAWRHVFAVGPVAGQSRPRADPARSLRRRHRGRVPPRRGADVPAPARAPRAEGAARPHGDARAHRREVDPPLVRRPHRQRAAALGCGRRGHARARSSTSAFTTTSTSPASSGGAAATTTSQLDNLYTGNDARAAKVVQDGALGRRRPAADARPRLLRQRRPRRVHGRLLQRARHRGALARRIDSDGPTVATRCEALETGEIQAVFAVDLFNEGVDLPRVDTVLFLRPTE